MFRVSAILFALLSFFATIVEHYRWSSRLVQSPLECDGLLNCYAQIQQLGFLQIPFLEQLHYGFLIAMAVLLLGIFSGSLSLKNRRLKLIFWTFVLVGLLGVQFCLSAEKSYFPSPSVAYFIHTITGCLMSCIAVFMSLRAQAGYTKLKQAAPQWLLNSTLVILAIQWVLGVWLTANNAGLACAGFPQCNATWWPQASYLYVFDMLSPLSFDTKVALHWLHRVFSLAVFVSIVWLMLSMTRHALKKVRWLGATVSFLLLMQVATGIVSIKMQLPLWATAAHSALALLLIWSLLSLRFYLRYELIGEQSTAKTPPKAEAVEPQDTSLYGRLKSQLGKTRSGFGSVLSVLSLSNRKIDYDLLEEIETSLLIADVGLEVTTKIIAQLEEDVAKHQLKDASELSGLLKQQLLDILEPVNQPLVIPEQEGPFVILVVGVNGAGKTTTIGKLAQRLQREGKSVMLAAGDTFRAAAVEQLQVWGERNHIHVVAQHTGADSASVIFDGVQSAKAKGVDVLIADTAGRLHTKSNLMEELKKVKRIISRLDDSAPHEVLLVLDAGTGQNALSQAEHFNKAVELTGIALTKLDGTAKGGIIFALAKQQGVPVRFLGVGEGIDDLQDFNAHQFVDALFNEEA